MDMSSFEQVSREEFNLAIEASTASATFREQLARYVPQYYEGADGPDCMIHLGLVPRHGREASLKLLNLDTSQYLHPGVFRDHLAAGKPVLKR
jgi:hypothetical protein